MTLDDVKIRRADLKCAQSYRNKKKSKGGAELVKIQAEVDRLTAIQNEI